MKRSLALFAGLLAFASFARAQTIIVTPVASNGAAFDDGSFNQALGLVFTVNQPVSVTSVGYWDMFSDGVSGGPIKVGIFFASGPNTGTLVPGTEIDFTGTTGTLSGNSSSVGGHPGDFRTAPLTLPVTLPAGTDYAIVAQGFSPDEYVNGNNAAAANFNQLTGALTFDNSVYNNSASTAGFVLPTDNTVSGASGPQFLAGTFSAIPEPSTYAAIFGVLALGFAGMRAGKRRRLAV